MYKIGEFVIYGSEGVCEVEEISKINITKEPKNYYTLKPMHNNGKVFTPIDTKIFMRPIITSAEANKIIEEIPSIEEFKYDIKNVRVLQEHFKNLFKTHKCIDLLSIIISINYRKDELAKSGKKISQTEEKFLRMATSLIEDEFSVALGISKEEVNNIIENSNKA